MKFTGSYSINLTLTLEVRFDVYNMGILADQRIRTYWNARQMFCGCSETKDNPSIHLDVTVWDYIRKKTISDCQFYQHITVHIKLCSVKKCITYPLHARQLVVVYWHLFSWFSDYILLEDQLDISWLACIEPEPLLWLSAGAANSTINSKYWQELQ